VSVGYDDEDHGPYFFLAYAHTPEKPWVERLYRDLCAEVFERTTIPICGTVGFMDGTGIPLGGDWREEVARAHRARRPGNPSAIVPALWTPVDPEDMPEVAKRIQMNHADLGQEYAEEGFYTLIKNTLYRQQYVTAVQRLARHIIRTAETSRLQPCRVQDLGPQHNAFELPVKSAPADRRLSLIVVAPTLDRLPEGRVADFYGSSSCDWNPFHPLSHQSIADFAAGVARLHSYEPTVLSFDQGCRFVEERNPSTGLGLLLVDVWAGCDEEMARHLAHLDSLDVDWVGTMVLWNFGDPQTRARAESLRAALQALLPNRLGVTRPVVTTNSTRIRSLEELRTKLPEVLDHALRRYLNYADAHPPAGRIPPRPRLSGGDDPGAVRGETREEDPQ
jgi:FxsC-like protein